MLSWKTTNFYLSDLFLKEDLVKMRADTRAASSLFAVKNYWGKKIIGEGNFYLDLSPPPSHEVGKVKTKKWEIRLYSVISRT